MLYARIVTGSERNLIRLRIWLARHVYRPFALGGARRFGPRSVLKSSPVTRTAEAASIEYIARNTTIPVPRVHDVFTIDTHTYIIMDYIKGLEFSHKALSVEQRESIYEELKGYIAQMCALKPACPGRVESADGSGLFDTRFGRPFPPLESIEKFHSHIGHDAILKIDKHRKALASISSYGKSAILHKVHALGHRSKECSRQQWQDRSYHRLGEGWMVSRILGVYHVGGE